MRSPLTDLALVMISMSLLGACGDSDPVSNDHDIKQGRSDNNAIHFVDFALDAGVDSFPGIAVSTVDLNDDGLPDLTVGSRHGVSIYQNVGDGRFVDISWVLPANDLPGTTIVYADIDDDQDLDLFLGNQEGKSTFLINNGEAGFSYGEVGLPSSAGAQGASFADIDGDGDLDMYLCIGRQPGAFSGAGGNGGLNHLLRNEGGKFVESTTVSAVQGNETDETFQSLFADFDRDGDPDLLFVNDAQSDKFFLNDGGQFNDASTDWLGDRITELMGLSVADFDGNGSLDVYSTDKDSDTLYSGDNESGFTNVYPKLLADGTDSSAIMTGWGCAFIDADNDGDPDVITVSSYDSEHYLQSGAYRMGALVMLENKGAESLQELDKAAGNDFGPPLDGQGLAIADLDLDGDLDVAVALDQQPGLENFPAQPAKTGVLLLRNEGSLAPKNHFLRLDLRQPTPNHWAVGAIVEVVANQLRGSRVITAGESYRSSHDMQLHFGLGANTEATVTVQWPDGSSETFEKVPAGHRRIIRGEGVSAGGIREGIVFKAQDCHGDCEACDPICNRFNECNQLSQLSVSTLKQCLAQCKADPLSHEEYSCIETATCEQLYGCLIVLN